MTGVLQALNKREEKKGELPAEAHSFRSPSIRLVKDDEDEEKKGIYGQPT